MRSCLQLQDLLASKIALEAGLKEVDVSLPELKHKVQATVSEAMQVQGKNEVLRLEADMLQRVSMFFLFFALICFSFFFLVFLFSSVFFVFLCSVEGKPAGGDP